MSKKIPNLVGEQLKRVEAYSGLGLSWEHIATLLEISCSALEDLRKRQPEINVYAQRGRAKMSAKLRNSAYSIATQQNPNPRMIEFLLKTREGFREHQIVEHIVADKTSTEFKALNHEERKTKIDKLLKMREICERAKKVEK